MSSLNKFRKFGTLAILFTAAVLTGCDNDDDNEEPTPVPPVENEEEVITDVTLIFASTTDTVMASAQDPDGEGLQELVVLDTIWLDTNKTYKLTYEILNSLETPAEDIGDEIEEEGDEHQIFYSFDNNAFSSPTGDGNTDDAADPMNYGDSDVNGNPIGLVTTWTTSTTTLTNGSFRVAINHQPDVKTATSSIQDGETEVDLTFVLNIK